ncbi:MAG: hypothetical protein ACK5V4_00945, partial [Alphaproteobacteria bacterium]
LNAMRDEEFFAIVPIVIEIIIKKGIRKAEYFNIPNILIRRYCNKKEELNFQSIHLLRTNICGAILNALKDEKSISNNNDDLIYSKDLKTKVDIIKSSLSERNVPHNLKLSMLQSLMNGVAYDELLVRLQTFLGCYNAIQNCFNNIAETDAIMMCISGVLKGFYIADEEGRSWCQDTRHNSDKGMETKLFNFNLLVSYLHYNGLSVQNCIELYSVFEFLINDENAHSNLLKRSNQDSSLLKKMPAALSLIFCQFIHQIVDRDNAIEMLKTTMRDNISDKFQYNNHWYIVAKSLKKAKVANESAEIMCTEATGNFIAILDELHNMRPRRRTAVDEMNLKMISEVMGNTEFISHISFYSTELRQYLNQTYETQNSEVKAIISAIIWRKFFIHREKGEYNGVKMMLEYILMHRNAIPMHMQNHVHYKEIDESILEVIEQLRDFGLLDETHNTKLWSDFYRYSSDIFRNFAREIIVYDIEDNLTVVDALKCEILSGFLNNLILCSQKERQFLSSSSLKSLVDLPGFSLADIFSTMREMWLRKILFNAKNLPYLVNIKMHNRLSLQELFMIPEGHDSYFLYLYSRNSNLMQCISMVEAINFYEKDRELLYISSFIELYKKYDSESKDVLKMILKRRHNIKLYRLLCENKMPHDLIERHKYSLIKVVSTISCNYYDMQFIMRGYKQYPEFRDIIVEELKLDSDAALEKFGLIFKHVKFDKKIGSKKFNIELMNVVLQELSIRKTKHPKTKSIKYLESLGFFLECIKDMIDEKMTANDIVSTFTNIHNRGVKFKTDILMVMSYMSASKYSKVYNAKAIFQLIESGLIKDVCIAVQCFSEMGLDVNIFDIINGILREESSRKAFLIMMQGPEGLEYLKGALHKSQPIHVQLISIFADERILEKYEYFKNLTKDNVSICVNMSAKAEEMALVESISEHYIDVESLQKDLKVAEFSYNDARRLNMFLKEIIKLDINHPEIISDICNIYSTAHYNSFLFATSNNMVDMLNSGEKWCEVSCFAYHWNVVKGDFQEELRYR